MPYLHDWVPFTYTVKAFRSAISGGGSIRDCLIFLLILFLIFTGLTILEFTVRARKMQEGKNTWMVWLEEHGLVAGRARTGIMDEVSLNQGVQGSNP